MSERTRTAINWCMTCIMLLLPAFPATTTADSETAPGEFAWMQPGAAQTEIHRQVTHGSPPLDTVRGTTLPRPTSDMAAYSREFRLDIAALGSPDHPGDPAATSQAINAALQQAKQVGANRIIFPAGTYLISADEPIVIDHQDTIIDLNGAVLQINSNALKQNTVVVIQEPARNLRLTNGEIRGDRDSHDYTTHKGTHEHCMGLTVRGGRGLEIDRLVIANVPGSGVSTRIDVSRREQNLHWIAARTLAPGRLSDTGEIEADDTTLVTPRAMDLAKARGAFEFGYTLGYQGYPSIKSRVYVACFYDEQQRFLTRRDCLQFRKEPIPAGAKFVRLQFNQPHAKDGGEGMVGRITDLDYPVDVHFHHNRLVNNRTLGMAFCGGQNWVIEHNTFEGNGGQAPGFGVDFEDGWDLMREIVFRHNQFRDNHAGDLVVCAGTELIVEANDFQKSVVFYDRTNNYAFRRNVVNGSRVLFKTGIKHAVIEHNHYRQAALEIRWNENHWPDVPPLTLVNETIEQPRSIAGNHLVFDHCVISDAHLTTYKSNRLVAFRNSELRHCSVTLGNLSQSPAVLFENCTISLADRPLLRGSWDHLGPTRLVGNRIVNASAPAVLELTAGSKPAARASLTFVDNQVEQRSESSVIRTPTPVSETMNLTLAGNAANRPLLPSGVDGAGQR